MEGKVAKEAGRNPHVELEIDMAPGLVLPADLARRALPAQSTPVRGARLLARAALPTRRDTRWAIELAPLTRMEAWKVPEIKADDSLSVLGFTLIGERGEAVVRAEYLFTGGRTYGLRSSPA